MKVDLTKKQCSDLEWSILIALATVQQQYKKEEKEIDTSLTKKRWKLHDYIKKAREENG